MKLIKQFTCLVACFVILSSSFMVGYAADEEEYFPAVDDLIDMGFVLDENGDYVYFGHDDPFELGFSFYFTNQKNSPNFDPMNLPWSSMPVYIQDIINMKVTSYALDSSNTQIPIVILRVRPSVVEVYVGINCFLGRLNNAKGSFNLFSRTPAVSSFFSYSKCYWAIYSHSGDLNQAWAPCPVSPYGDTGKLNLVQSYFFGNLDDGNLDYYVWGGNAVTVSSGPSINLAIPVYSSDPTSLQVLAHQSTFGFSDGIFLTSQDQYPFQYFEYFNPPTNDDLVDDLLSGIGDSLNASGDSTLTTLPDEAFDDYNKAESDLVDDYNPDHLEDDLDIELDSSALSFIWELFDHFVTADNAVFTLFVSIMAVGIIALILGR